MDEVETFGEADEQIRREAMVPPSWQEGRGLVVDTETTGLDEPHDPAAIVELGAVVMHEGRVVCHRSAIFEPGKPIHPKAAEVHGITNEQVKGRPRIGDRNTKSGRTPIEGLDALCAKHGVTAIVGYNLLGFDLPILRRELGQRWLELEAAVGLVVDPLVVVRLDTVGRFWKGQGRHKLTAVAARLGLDGPEPGRGAGVAHRAAWDCVLAGRVLWHLREHVPDDVDEVRDLMTTEYQRQRADLDAWHSLKRGAA